MTENLARLLEIMARLRDPVSGCPWDVEQTFATIAPYTVEEAYEVADAIERGDIDDIRDELGDLLFQVVFHARMAEDAGLFDFGDVVEAVIAKMIRRHPHVFGNDEAKADAAAPHEVLLVLDANTGQNAVSQLKAFDDAIGVTGVILTKLDGTAKGGVLAAIAQTRSGAKATKPLALRYIGIGEGLDDLRAFSAEDFVSALLD